MSRKAKSKVRKAFSCHNPDTEEFRTLMEEFSEELEIYAAYQEYLEGRDFYKLDPETRMESLCTLLK